MSVGLDVPGALYTQGISEKGLGKTLRKSTENVAKKALFQAVLFLKNIPFYVYPAVSQEQRHRSAAIKMSITPKVLLLRGYTFVVNKGSQSTLTDPLMKILICDDDQTITSLIRFNLERENVAELFIATNGYKAMKLLAEHKFDLLITDIHMPYHNGDEIMQTLHQDSSKQTPVIMMSSDAEEEIKVLAKKQGVRHFLTKPFKVQELVKLVKRICQ